MTTLNLKYSQQQAAIVWSAEIKEMMMHDVINVLYLGARNDLDKELAQIMEANNALIVNNHPSFLYRGKYYNLDTEPAANPVELDPSLHDRMKDYLAEKQQIDGYEVPCIEGILKSLFMASNRISDYKQVLPEYVHRAFDRFSDTGATKAMLPQELARFQKRIAPFITIMKGRMLQNFVQGKTP
jgi:hypothetical protein